jgi:threonine dehydrogenase-like Zn-dependent dehydrogenase
LPLEKLITHRFPLNQVAEAFRLFKSGGRVCKVLIEPEAVA